MINHLEQLKALELKANFTPPERQYFYKLRDELEAIVGGVSIEKLDKPTDVAQAKRIRTKLEEILKFVQDREMEKEVWDREMLIDYLRRFNITDNPEKWMADNDVSFSRGGVEFFGSLNLSKVNITYLPDPLIVGMDLILRDCYELETLPTIYGVWGDIDLSHCRKLKNLDNLDGSRRNLNLTGCSGLTSLPDSLYVKESLFLEGCTGLTSLPRGLYVGGGLEVVGLSEDIKLQARILKIMGKIVGKVWEE